MENTFGPEFESWKKTAEAEELLKDHNAHAKFVRGKLSNDKINNWTLEDIYEIYDMFWANSNFGNKRWRKSSNNKRKQR